MRKTHSLLAVLSVLSLLLLAPPADASPGEPPSVRVTALHQWIVERMVRWSPPGRPTYDAAVETYEEGLRRYESAADDLIRVTYDPSEMPLFHGNYARAMTASLLASVAFHESSFRKDVDTGVGKYARGDNGRSWCLMQVMLGRPDKKTGRTPTRVVLTEKYLRFIPDTKKNLEKYPDSIGGEDLVSDRSMCFRVGLRAAHLSFNQCGRRPVDERLTLYAGGKTCTAAKAVEKSRIRVRTAQRWLASVRPPMLDLKVMELLHVSPSKPPDRGPSKPPSGGDKTAFLWMTRGVVPQLLM